MDKKAMISEQTKKAFQNSFLELYAKNSISSITVGAITKKAGYNRCTFYNYYTDINNLLEDIENTMLSEIRENAEKNLKDFRFENVNKVFEQFVSLFETYGNTFYVLLSKSENSSFRNRFKEIALSIYRQAFAGKLDAEQIEWLISYISSAGLGLVEHWYETGQKYSTEEFLKLAQPLIMTGTLGYLQDKFAISKSQM